MPTYDYTCDHCQVTKEIIHSIHKNPSFKCPTCGTKLRRQIGLGALATNNLTETLDDYHEKEHTKKVKDIDRAAKSRKRLFGSEAGCPNEKPDPKHIVKRGKHIAGHEYEVDKTELTKAMAKDSMCVEIAKKIVDKNNKKT